MKHFTFLLFLCVAAHNADAAAFAGTTHILVDGDVAYWVPVAGGTATAIEDGHGVPVAAAYDGTRFAIVSLNSGVVVKLYDEGAVAPSVSTLLDPDNGASPPQIVWDGSRYVAVWQRRQQYVYGANINAAGVVDGTFEAFPDFRHAFALAAAPGQVLALDQWTIASSPQTLAIVAARFDTTLSEKKKVYIADLPRTQSSSLRVMSVVPYRGGFYMVYLRSTDSLHAEVAGRMMSGDGTLLAEQILDANAAGTVDVDLFHSGTGMIAVIKRQGLAPVMGVVIHPDGSVAAPMPLSANVEVRTDYGSPAETVRLQNGRLALVSVHAGVGTVTLLNEPSTPSKRRTARH